VPGGGAFGKNLLDEEITSVNPATFLFQKFVRVMPYVGAHPAVINGDECR
jgi:hypothetical protein